MPPQARDEAVDDDDDRESGDEDDDGSVDKEAEASDIETDEDDDDVGDAASENEEETGTGALPLPPIDTPGLGVDDSQFGSGKRKFKGVALKGKRYQIVGGLAPKDSKRASPLVFAIVNSDPELINCLLQLGASSTAGDAHEIAERNGSPKVLEALREGQFARIIIERRPSPFNPDRKLPRSSSQSSLDGSLRPPSLLKGSISKRSRRSRQLADAEGDWDSAASDGSSFVDEESPVSGDGSPAMPRWRKDLVVENESRRKDRQRSRQQDRDIKGGGSEDF
jgi:hypothetical protein